MKSLYYVVTPTSGLFYLRLFMSRLPNWIFPYRRIIVTSLPLYPFKQNSSLHPVLTLYFIFFPPVTSFYILIYVVWCLSSWDMCNADYCKATPHKHNLFFPDRLDPFSSQLFLLNVFHLNIHFTFLPVVILVTDGDTDDLITFFPQKNKIM